MRETRNVFLKSWLNIFRKKKPFYACTFFSFIFEGHPYQASLWCAPLQASPLIATHSPFKSRRVMGMCKRVWRHCQSQQKMFFLTLFPSRKEKQENIPPPPLKWLITICYELDCYLNVRLHEDPIFYLSGLSKKLTFSNVAHVHPHFCILHHDSTMLQRVVLQSAVICSNVERESERIWGWVCTFECVCGGGRAQRIPIPLYSSQQAAGSRIQKEEGSRELGHHGRGVCVCVCESERACALPMPPTPLPPSIPPSCSLCIA